MKLDLASVETTTEIQKMEAKFTVCYLGSNPNMFSLHSLLSAYVNNTLDKLNSVINEKKKNHIKMLKENDIDFYSEEFIEGFIQFIFESHKINGVDISYIKFSKKNIMIDAIVSKSYVFVEDNKKSYVDIYTGNNHTSQDEPNIGKENI